MTIAGDSPLPGLDPRYSNEDREDLRCLGFLVVELNAMRRRGLVEESAYATLSAETAARREAVEHRALARAELDQARRVRASDPVTAARWADQARGHDPDLHNAWELAVSSYRKARDYDRAEAVSTEAVARFPDFPIRPEELRREREARSALPGQGFAIDPLTAAREAFERGDDATVVSLCSDRLADQPDHLDAMVLLAFVKQKLGENAEALRLYQRLQELQPENTTWGRWVATVTGRLPSGIRPAIGPAAPTRPTPRPQPEPIAASPRITWSSVAEEFLLDHWQKLILCLAVLLIVVSSNVGAYQLLGPRIWSPMGKMVLGLVYTAMFAAFGHGLVRWGAARAGRIMLFTTLIVVPANFMLAGESQIFSDPTPWKLALIGVDALALFLLVRGVGGSLGVSRSPWALATVFLALSALNATSGPGNGWPRVWQVSLFLGPAVIFLAAVRWINGSYADWAAASKDPAASEIVFGALGLFAFAFGTGVARTGGFVLQLAPALFALPAMVGALATMDTARSVRKFEIAPSLPGRLRYLGVVLSILAFGLALARSPGPSAILSGNTLATALVGFGLYVTMLVRERHPAYLYLGFGALLAASVGAFYFLQDRLKVVEDLVRLALGYPDALPRSFQAIKGLALNAGLAILALFFQLRWRDNRLARHCHLIGLPLSVACCVWSAFEPTAGVICLSGYTILYALAVVVFAEPRMTYLAALSVAGVAYLGVGLMPGATIGGRALVAALIGLGEWGIGLLLVWRGAGPDYRRPLARVAMGMSILAVVGALGSFWAVEWNPAAVPISSAWAMLVVTLTTGLVFRERPSLPLAYAVVLSGSLAHALFVMATGGRWAGGLSFGQYGVASGTAALLLAILRSQLTRWTEARGGAIGHFPGPVGEVALGWAGLAVMLSAVHLGIQNGPWGTTDDLTIATGLGLTGLAFGVLIGAFPWPELAWLALGCGLGAWVGVGRAWLGLPTSGIAGHAAIGSGYALALLSAGEALRGVLARTPSSDDLGRTLLPRARLFVQVIPWVLVVVVAGASGLAVGSSRPSPMSIAALAISGAAMLGLARWRPSAWMVDVGLYLGLGSLLSLTHWRLDGGPSDEVLAAWLVVVVAATMLGLWVIGRISARVSGGLLYTNGCDRVASVIGWAPGLLGLLALNPRTVFHSQAVGALALASPTFVLLAATRHRPSLTYRAIFSAVLAVYVVVFHSGSGSPETAHIPGLIAILWSLALEGLGLAVRAGAPEARERLFLRPIFRSALILTILGGLAAYWSVLAMLLATLAFLVLVKGMSAREWIYPAVATSCVALYSGYLDTRPDPFVQAAVVVAYVLWLMGMIVRRFDPALVSALRLPQRGHDVPLFGSAVVSALVAALLRAFEVQRGVVAWHDSAGLLLSLAAFSVLMARAYPHPGWPHLSILLASTAAGMAAFPGIDHPAWWLTLGMALAVGWLLVAKGREWVESRFGPLPGIEETGGTEALGFWSRAFFSVGAVIGLAMVASGMSRTILYRPAVTIENWWGVLAAIGLGGVFLGTKFGGSRPISALIGLHATFVTAVWWVGVSGSPLLSAWTIQGGRFLPLATALLGITAVWGALRYVNRPGWVGPFFTWIDGDPLARLDAYAIQAGSALSVLSVGLTLGRSGLSTVGTFALATVALGMRGFARRSVFAAYLSGGLCLATGIWGASEFLRQVLVETGPDRVVFAGLGLLAAVALLWWVAGLLRERDRDSLVGDPLDWPARSVPFAFEQWALVGAIFCASGIVSTLFLAARPSDRVAMFAVGELFGLALVAVGLFRRWGVTWLVHATQGLLVGAYLYYRWAFPIPSMTDALILTLFGYLSFGLAEAMHRIGWRASAKATGQSALVLPMLPLALLPFDQGLQGENLLIVFGAATFYGTACHRLQSRSIGYASALLFNAGLWLLWWRFGWKFADRPQFFLVPVGLSAILFAEVNRPTFNRSALNTIRGVGLSTIYLSLAMPIWQFRSLGAWAALLLASLAGILVGIGLRVQTFLWLGLAGFVLDVVYQLGRVGSEHTLAKWGIMLTLGIAMVFFVALNEKQRLGATLVKYFNQARDWE